MTSNNKKFWLKDVIVPGVVALVVSLTAFWVSYTTAIKPDMLQRQAEFLGMNLINNVRVAQDHIEELKAEDISVTEEERNCGEIEECLEKFKGYYKNRKFSEALDEFEKGDKLGRDYFSGLWAELPRLDIEDAA